MKNENEIKRAKALYDKMLSEKSSATSTEMMVEYAKQEKRAFAMEVIEKIKSVPTYPNDTFIREILYFVQSLLAKEEVHVDIDSGKETIKLNEAPPYWQEQFEKANPEMRFSESDEVKAGDEVVCRGKDWTVLAIHKNRAWLFRRGNVDIETVEFLDNIKKQPTLEQKARRKAEEICREGCWNEDVISVITETLLIDPKTL
jgi:hypothetical protein